MSNQNNENNLTGLEIAVIGMAGRFPGADNIEKFWENLKNGVESITLTTEQEVLDSGTSPELLQNPDFVKSRGGVFEGKEFFDAPLFGYMPLEAEIMDPQARKLHEGVYEALENAGCNPGIYNGLIGLYAGASSNFYWEGLTLMSGKRNELGQFASAHLTGREFLSTLVSYKLNLKGPAFTVLTACSTSLVAIHLACQAILNGECHIAVAGGVSIDASNKTGYLYQEGMIMSRDGHCRAFDAKASGTSMGGGMGVVVLKALEDAIADKDHIYAVVKGTAINNDGQRKGAYSAPSIQGQSEAIRAALQVADIDPQTIGYIETHGTGTELGDPIEIEALKLAFGNVNKHSCAIGSVKTNIGHLDAAAGVSGFIKAVLCLKHRLIPPSLNFEKPNPKIDFENSPFYVNTQLTEWKPNANGDPLRAGVSSFGIGGTNAHAVLEEPPVTMEEEDLNDHEKRPFHLILLSAKTPSALDRMTQNLADHSRKNREYIENHHLLPGIAYTLQTGRKNLPHRRMMVASDFNEALETLENPNHENMKTSFTSTGNPPVIFMFTGQGAQYENMGLDLYRTESIFQEEADRCFDFLKSLTGTNFKEILFPPTRSGDPAANSPAKKIDCTEFTQPLLFVFEYALSKLLIRWGIEPYAMIGHSIGEYIAAHLSGVFSLEDALKLVALRGKLMQSMPAGSMLGVPLPPTELQTHIHNNKDICIAAVNSPSGCVLSGPREPLERFAADLSSKGIDTRFLHTSHAFHSSMMDPILDSFKTQAAAIPFKSPTIPYISNVSGTWITIEEASSPAYWANHLRKPVLFSKGIEELLKLENAIFIEVGPGKTLSTFVNRHTGKTQGHPVVNLIRHPNEETSDQKYLTEKLGLLWLAGKTIDWKGYYNGHNKRCIPLPAYPFEKKRYWMELKNGLAAQGPQAVEVSTSSSSLHDTAQQDSQSNYNNNYAAPSTPTEEALAKTWQAFFGIPRIGITDDFFELGGDSLKATALAAKIHKELDVPLPLTELFNSPTIKGLARFIDKSRQEKFLAFEIAEEKDFYPLSSAQKRLFLLQHIGFKNTAYNLPSIFILEGEPNPAKLRDTFNRLIQRHAVLRTSFHIINAEPAQVIHPGIDFNLEFIELTPGPVINTIRSFIAPFDLSKPPLLRAGLITEAPGKHILVIDMHHIITDGTSQAILTNDFISLYAGEELPPMRLQYKDYSQWQQGEKAKTALKKQEQYWLKEFPGEIPAINLPYDFPRPPIQNYAGNSIFFQLNPEKTKKLHDIARTGSATLFAVLIAAFDVFLSKLSNQDDIIVGIPSAGRQHADLQQIIGMFVNTLAIRTQVPGDSTFNTFLHHVKEKIVKALENQDYPFEDLVELSKIERNMSRNPLFDVMFVLQNTSSLTQDTRKPGLTDINLKPYTYEHQATKFDLTLYAAENNNQLFFNMQYSTNLFKEETIRRFIAYFENIVSSIGENPHTPIFEIDILSDEEKNRLLFQFNNTDTQEVNQIPFHRLFENQVLKNPNKTAVAGIALDMDEPPHSTPSTPSAAQTGIPVSWTYNELNQKAEVVKSMLSSKQVKPGSIVGIVIEPSIEMMATILGIFKLGAAYLPIDPDYPEERIKFMLNDSSAPIVFISNGLSRAAEKVSTWNGETILLNSINKLTCPEPAEPTEPDSPGDLTDIGYSPAYVIYTSGTTGKPKGVILCHNNLVNYAQWFMEKAKLTPADNSILTSSYAFDLGYTSIYPALAAGAALHIIPRNTILMPGKLLDYIKENRITYLKVTPSLLSVIVQNPGFSNETSHHLRLIVVGGEPINLDVVEKLHSICPDLEIINHYGPTESTIGCIARTIDFHHWKEYTQTPTIGQPIANTQAFILDKFHRLLPIGVPGELYISGKGLALGYLNHPELTRGSFAHLFVKRWGQKLLRRGDDLQSCEEKGDRQVNDEPHCVGGRLQSNDIGISFDSFVDSDNIENTPHQNTPLNQSFGKVQETLSRKGFLAAGGSLYRTGDLARWLPDGNIQFLGRVDTQVKIRGFRVEAAEVERVLAGYDGIEEVVVAARDIDDKSQKYLCAYIVTSKEVQVSLLREYLEKYVPGYMVPSYFVFLERMPLTPNGKVDKKALEAVEVSAVGQSDFVEPGSDLEKTIAAVWQEVLQTDKVGSYSNFFELGGNSLKIIQVNAKLNEILQKEIPVMTLFEYPTVHSLAEHLRKESEEKSFIEVVAQRSEDMDEGKARMKERMNRNRRGGFSDDE